VRRSHWLASHLMDGCGSSRLHGDAATIVGPCHMCGGSTVLAWCSFKHKLCTAAVACMPGWRTVLTVLCMLGCLVLIMHQCAHRW
jgi:hypothetical protein